MAVNIGNGLAHGGLVQDSLLIQHTGQEGGGADEVNLARDAFGIVKDAAEGVVGEEGALKAGGPDVVTDASEGVLQVQRLEMIANGQALIESLVGGQAKDVVPAGLTAPEPYPNPPGPLQVFGLSPAAAMSHLSFLTYFWVFGSKGTTMSFNFL